MTPCVHYYLVSSDVCDCGAMGDLFHEGVPDEFIDKVFAVMALTPQHTYLLLTKRPERMRAYLSQDWDEVGEKAARWPLIQQAVEDMGRRFDYLSANPVWPLPNVWLGVSCENQARADERIPLLLDTPAAHRWVSLEPLLGAIDLSLTGPKRDLAEQALEKLEWLAREYGSGLVCFEGNTRLEVWRQKDGTYRYQSQYVGLPAHEVNFTRAEALELLKGDADVEG